MYSFLLFFQIYLLCCKLSDLNSATDRVRYAQFQPDSKMNVSMLIEQILIESRSKIHDIMFVIEISFRQESFHKFTVWELCGRLKSVGQGKQHVIQSVNVRRTAETLILFNTFPNFYDG